MRILSKWGTRFVWALALTMPLRLMAQYGDSSPPPPPSPASSAPESPDTVPNTGANPLLSPLHQGGYVSVLGNFDHTISDRELKNGVGGDLLIGYRKSFYAFEAGFGYTVNQAVDERNYLVSALVFPLKGALENLYGVIGIGGQDYKKYLVATETRTLYHNIFVTAFADAGLGYIQPISIGNYEFGIRAEARYRYAFRPIERDSDFTPDISAPEQFNDIIVNVGFQFPMALKHPPAPPAPAPVTVVPVADEDHDGVPDDLDKCPGTPAGTKVDATGCPIAPPPCRAPSETEHISLEGCATGDSIVLHGVNFDFNKSTLTDNAKTILDDVTAELGKRPDIKVELGGYTDGRGSAGYNKRLSQRRAEAVKAYLESKGIDPSRTTAVGYGESNPIGDNKTDDGREMNRRVELKVVDSAPASAAAAPAGAAPADGGAAVTAPDAAPAPGVDSLPAAP